MCSYDFEDYVVTNNSQTEELWFVMIKSFSSRIGFIDKKKSRL